MEKKGEDGMERSAHKAFVFKTEWTDHQDSLGSTSGLTVSSFLGERPRNGDFKLASQVIPLDNI